jgi:hypothetical protein
MEYNMNKIRMVSLFLFLLPGIPLTSAEESTFPGVQKLMNEREFSAAGLEKLSPQEIKALNQWLISYTAGEAQVLVTTDEEVMEAERTQEILSSIKQPFSGWRGDTVFRLENGQVWQQRRRGNYHHNGSDTRVRITKNFMGFYKMTLLDSGKAVQVTRRE